VPMKAGHLNLSAFIIAFNSDTTAPGFVTKSFKLLGFKKLFAAPAKPPPALAAPALIFNACASVATARSSGARFPVSLFGNCVINFCRKLGKWSYCFANVPCESFKRPTRSSYAVGTPLTRSLRMTVNLWTSSCDSLEMEKARLFTAARFRSSRTLLMSSSSLEASAGVTTASLGESFLSCFRR
jgi:hypothetical protein